MSPVARAAVAIAFLGSLFLGGAFDGALPVAGIRTASAASSTDTAARTTTDSQALATAVRRLWAGRRVAPAELPARFSRPSLGVGVAVRRRGRLQTRIWETEGTVFESIALAIERARAELGEKAAARSDVIMLALPTRYRYYTRRLDSPGLHANSTRGMRGLEIGFRGIVENFPPFYAVATNRTNRRLIERFRRNYGLDEDKMANFATVRTFEADEYFIRLDGDGPAIPIERGNTFVPPDAVDRAAVQRLADLAGEWLINNLHSDGRMTYAFYPSAARESERNNVIRQWMATIALGRLARTRGDAELWRLVERNIDYNLARFYREEGPFGLIENRNTVKLGALAFATMAIAQHPRRARWARQEAALRRTIDFLWNEDGSFATYYKPRGKTGNVNFYPGEALLLWAQTYAETRDPGLLERFMQSFAYYRKWHLKEGGWFGLGSDGNRNPAFVAWHTQAYYAMWRETKEPALQSFVFTMNDWLLDLQQSEEDVRFRDMQGRFFAPGRDFGPPHASSTAVYVESLVDALALARAVGDTERAGRYEQAILRGFRSLMQLQFTDDIDMFYVSERLRPRVRGGLRTTVYDNRIRCDNVQHALDAALKYLALR